MVLRSRRIFAILGITLAIAFCAFLSYAGYTTALASRRQAHWHRLATYNNSFNIDQARAETLRLHNALLGFRNGQASADDVSLALDILANRAEILSQGETYALLSEVPTSRETVRWLRNLIARWSRDIEATREPDGAATIAAMLRDLTEIEPAMSAMVAASNVQNLKHITRSELEFQRALRVLVTLLTGLALCGGALIVLLTWLQSSLRLLHARKQTIKLQSDRFEAALNNMSQGLCMVGANARPVVCNQQFERMFGVSRRFVEQAESMSDVFRAARDSGVIAPEIINALLEAEERREQHEASSSFLAEADERCISVAHQQTAEGGWLATYTDITTMRQAQNAMSHMARHDALTDLSNRLHFRERMERAFSQQRRSGDSFSLLCIDLDRFKDVNDTLGHPAGDAILKEVASRLQACVRETDLVARLGGDEFAIIQFAADQKKLAALLARRVIDAVSTPYMLNGHRISIGASVGIALAPSDGTDADQLMRNADLALYRAKEGGRGVVRFFDHDVAREVEEQRILEGELRGALTRGEIGLVYQPQINLQTGRVSGFEALMRWDNPLLGSVSPSRFIPAAERIGAISALGAWTLREACEAATSWPDSVRVAVNLSPFQFKSGDVVKQVAEALAATGLAAGRLELEITETVLLQNEARTIEALHSLRSLGVRIALDDFGTGYSSPSYLLRFPFDRIKIDRCFVGDSAGSSPATAIVRSITSLALELGLSTTAEGVETPWQMEAVRAMGCTEAQGYLVSKPLPLAGTGPFLHQLLNAAA